MKHPISIKNTDNSINSINRIDLAFKRTSGAIFADTDCTLGGKSSNDTKQDSPKQQQQARIAYLPALGANGSNLDYFMALIDAGINILEVGIPYSDPIVDGQVIVDAMQGAISFQEKSGALAMSAATNGIVESSLNVIKQIRQANKEIALIVFSYYNLVQSDLTGFLHKAKQAGADGILIVDLPHEESAGYRHLCASLGLATIVVIAPSTPKERIEQLVKNMHSGFIYYACHKGVTGVKNSLPEDLPERIALIRECTHLPVAVGFGVATNDMVKTIATVANGVIVGSYLVDLVNQEVGCASLNSAAKQLLYSW